jgi:outer membrane phospholipase A
LWDIWNAERSWPIDDTNHRPELFWRHRLAPQGRAAALGVSGFDLGYRHESNGRGLGEDPLDPGDGGSKSYFGAYGILKQAWQGDRAQLRLDWEIRSFQFLAENPDLPQYLGHLGLKAELDFRFLREPDGSYFFDQNTLSFSSNSSSLRSLPSRHPALPASRHFNWGAGLAVGLAPLMEKAGGQGSLHLFLQYFSGWGEYLSTYNDLRDRRVYFGLALRPAIEWP